MRPTNIAVLFVTLMACTANVPDNITHDPSYAGSPAVEVKSEALFGYPDIRYGDHCRPTVRLCIEHPVHQLNTYWGTDIVRNRSVGAARAVAQFMFRGEGEFECMQYADCFGGTTSLPQNRLCEVYCQDTQNRAREVIMRSPSYYTTNTYAATADVRTEGGRYDQFRVTWNITQGYRYTLDLCSTSDPAVEFVSAWDSVEGQGPVRACWGRH